MISTKKSNTKISPDMDRRMRIICFHKLNKGDQCEIPWLKWITWIDGYLKKTRGHNGWNFVINNNKDKDICSNVSNVNSDNSSSWESDKLRIWCCTKFHFVYPSSSSGFPPSLIYWIFFLSAWEFLFKIFHN